MTRKYNLCDSLLFIRTKVDNIVGHANSSQLASLFTVCVIIDLIILVPMFRCHLYSYRSEMGPKTLHVPGPGSGATSLEGDGLRAFSFCELTTSGRRTTIGDMHLTSS
jgi:hypothetical protein